AMPVAPVVARTEARACEVRHFIVLITGCCQGFHHPGVGPGIVFLGDGRETSLVVAPRKASALFDGQRIGGNMLASQRQELVDGGLPVLAGSTRDTEDDVEVYISKPRPACCAICCLGIRGAVPAAQGFEISVIERLHAKTQTVATARAKSAKLL